MKYLLFFVALVAAGIDTTETECGMHGADGALVQDGYQSEADAAAQTSDMGGDPSEVHEWPYWFVCRDPGYVPPHGMQGCAMLVPPVPALLCGGTYEWSGAYCTELDDANYADASKRKRGGTNITGTSNIHNQFILDCRNGNGMGFHSSFYKYVNIDQPGYQQFLCGAPASELCIGKVYITIPEDANCEDHPLVDGLISVNAFGGPEANFRSKDFAKGVSTWTDQSGAVHEFHWCMVVHPNGNADCTNWPSNEKYVDPIVAFSNGCVWWAKLNPDFQSASAIINECGRTPPPTPEPPTPAPTCTFNTYRISNNRLEIRYAGSTSWSLWAGRYWPSSYYYRYYYTSGSYCLGGYSGYSYTTYNYQSCPYETHGLDSSGGYYRYCRKDWIRGNWRKVKIASSSGNSDYGKFLYADSNYYWDEHCSSTKSYTSSYRYYQINGNVIEFKDGSGAWQTSKGTGKYYAPVGHATTRMFGGLKYYQYAYINKKSYSSYGYVCRDITRYTGQCTRYNQQAALSGGSRCGFCTWCSPYCRYSGSSSYVYYAEKNCCGNWKVAYIYTGGSSKGYRGWWSYCYSDNTLSVQVTCPTYLCACPYCYGKKK